ncbi:sulfite exporter TauE/SafE family protein [Sphingobium sp. DEHP117]|uniref:sulfite exporter TauE/SafE family protein n=1 Tax=Sphingobium sp. DEHP117 TaxID=2993436 RepID=UPI0027D56459|nr:TSUP family transporter [Sphingobium sp. DEHP117]MDQ4419232.1 sulfite exporter TauE/SafE family protein [Sphingobium sp. DEHP117]
MPTEPMSLLLILLSLCSIGFAKGGLAGLGILGMPLMAMVFPPVEAAAILLPVLIAQDAFSVWLYRDSWDKAIVAWMLPGALVGIAAAAIFAASVSPSAILALLGMISMAFGLWRLWMAYHAVAISQPSTRQWPGIIFGFFCGFTSQIGHAGAPPLQMWLIPKRLPHRVFVGTGAVLFAAINWAKVPAFVALGAFSRDSLLLAALFIPVATLATLAGARLVNRMNGPRFYVFANIMLVAIGAKLVWDALS